MQMRNVNILEKKSRKNYFSTSNTCTYENRLFGL